MERHHSTLELAKHDDTARAPELARNDETARAPERDYDATAFELDASALAPEIVPETTPQVFYDGSLPEAHSNEKPTEENLPVIKPALKWPWIVIALILAAAIAIGVSVGIWHHREHKSLRVSRPMALPNPNTTSHPNITQAPQYILNDTSLAAVSLSNGDRHLFFQDNTGLIRRAVRTESNGQWTTSPNLNASAGPSSNSGSIPKRYTPLAALAATGFADESEELNAQISLYYVSENHILSSNILPQYGVWAPDPNFGNYSTAVDTRSLSISLFRAANYTNSTLNVALLYYENPNGNISALLQRLLATVRSPTQDQWVDITSQESKGLPHEFRNAPGFNYRNSFYAIGSLLNTTYSHTLYEADPIAIYSTPFTSAASFFGSSAMFYSPIDPLPNTTVLAGGSFFEIVYDIEISGPGNFDLLASTPPSRDPTPINQSDIALFGSSQYYGVWINGTRAVLISKTPSAVTVPDNEFPFTRLASVTPNDGSTTYLYHQMNGTTFAEEQWDDTLQSWLPPGYITVSDF